MDEQPGLSDQYRMSSPWPIFIAVGLAIAEVGIVWALLPIAVGGLLLFTGSIAGILKEAGYVGSPWTALAGLGALLVVVGAVVYVYTGAPLTADMLATVLQVGQSVAYRGVAIAIAGVFAIVGAIAGWVMTVSAVDAGTAP